MVFHGTDNAVYHKWTDNYEQSWSSERVPAPFTIADGSSPAIAAWGPNNLDVFARGTDGYLYHQSLNGSAGWQPAWDQDPNSVLA